jgi:hypothetical protein
MSDSEVKSEKKGRDSFDVPVEKSPLFMFALLQIPIVIFMVVMIYILYKTQFS